MLFARAGDCGALVMTTLQSGLCFRSDMVTAFLKVLAKTSRSAAGGDDGIAATPVAAPPKRERAGVTTCSRVDVWLLLIISGMVQFKKQVCCCRVCFLAVVPASDSCAAVPAP